LVTEQQLLKYKRKLSYGRLMRRDRNKAKSSSSCSQGQERSQDFEAKKILKI